MAQKFKTGDIVQLKSGGPQMTVKEAPREPLGGEIICQWFGGKELEQGWFPPDSLKKADPDAE
jgi:uncharacterized protein YodC (DUF2158 family)